MIINGNIKRIDGATSDGIIIDFEEWVTTDVLAKKLGVETVTIRAWIARGKIDAIIYGAIYLVNINTPYPERRNSRT